MARRAGFCGARSQVYFDRSGSGSLPSFRSDASSGRFRPTGFRVSGYPAEVGKAFACQERLLPESESSLTRCAAARQIRAQNYSLPATVMSGGFADFGGIRAFMSDDRLRSTIYSPFKFPEWGSLGKAPMAGEQQLIQVIALQRAKNEGTSVCLPASLRRGWSFVGGSSA